MSTPIWRQFSGSDLIIWLKKVFGFFFFGDMRSDIYESTLRNLLSQADVTINGDRPYDIIVHNPDTHRRILREGSLGLGEAYVEGWWDCPRLDQFFDRVFRARLDEKVAVGLKAGLYILQSRIFNLQNIKRAFTVGEQHYDAGNDLYRAMLDKHMQYTCGYWNGSKTLDQAQQNKLELICKKINIRKGMRILELGCGFGGFAYYAAKNYGAHVTGVTVSRNQVELGRELCRGLPVDIRLSDYRDADGLYDAVISIGIMEHVGYKNYRTYMEKAYRHLKPDGIAFVHTIGRNTSVSAVEPWIHKYIFPNGMLPSIPQLSRAMEGLFVMEDWHNFGPDYDRTLMAWHRNFEKAWPRLKDKYDERFYRMWRYYLLGCAGGFRSRTQQLWQIVMTKEGMNQPKCRIV